MKIIKPKKLCQGDLIGIISPGSTPDDLNRINKGVLYLEKNGYNVLLGENVGKYNGYLAGSDKERLNDLHSMFENKSVRAIICLRGGYGSPRLLSKINYDLIKNNPKIFVGYSDITALQMAFMAKCGLVTFAGPMLAVDFHSEINRYTEEMFWSCVTSSKKIGYVLYPENSKIEVMVQGEGKGKIFGGNLALLCSSLGSKFLPKPKNKILIIEDTGEVPYRVDRLLNQLVISDYFKNINGLILGQFTDCEETDKEKKTLSLQEVFNDYLSKLKIPVITNFPHGHIKQNYTIPFGIDVKLDTKEMKIEFLEAAVE